MNKHPLNLRAHHGLCLHFFQGKGYSPEFVENMRNVKAELEKNPLVRIIGQADMICTICPNHAEGICNTEKKVAEYDRQVLLRCGISADDIMPFHHFHELIQKNILIPGKRSEVCGNCQWDSLCHH